jgi:hypothetical protein
MMLAKKHLPNHTFRPCFGKNSESVLEVIIFSIVLFPQTTFAITSHTLH